MTPAARPPPAGRDLDGGTVGGDGADDGQARAVTGSVAASAAAGAR
jgi:hypothetical protein